MTLPIAVTLAMILDLATANPSTEANPLARAILEAGPLAAFAVKVALVSLVLATVAIVRRTRPGVASGVGLVAVVAGGIGALSNLRMMA